MPHAAVSNLSTYADFVNPQWVRLLDLLDMNVRYKRCAGAELFRENGDCYLDFLSGYCVHNIGHNHPRHHRSSERGVGSSRSRNAAESCSGVAGELAQRLCKLAGGNLKKVFFASSGSEGVEAAIKFSRATTKRNALLYCEGAFHGLTCGALSLMDNAFWREGFGSLLPDTQAIPFGDIASGGGKTPYP